MSPLLSMKMLMSLMPSVCPNRRENVVVRLSRHQRHRLIGMRLINLISHLQSHSAVLLIDESRDYKICNAW